MAHTQLCISNPNPTKLGQTDSSGLRMNCMDKINTQSQLKSDYKEAHNGTQLFKLLVCRVCILLKMRNPFKLEKSAVLQNAQKNVRISCKCHAI